MRIKCTFLPPCFHIWASRCEPFLKVALHWEHLKPDGLASPPPAVWVVMWALSCDGYWKRLPHVPHVRGSVPLCLEILCVCNLWNYTCKPWPLIVEFLLNSQTGEQGWKRLQERSRTAPVPLMYSPFARKSFAMMDWHKHTSHNSVRNWRENWLNRVKPE